MLGWREGDVVGNCKTNAAIGAVAISINRRADATPRQRVDAFFTGIHAFFQEAIQAAGVNLPEYSR